MPPTPPLKPADPVPGGHVFAVRGSVVIITDPAETVFATIPQVAQ